MRLHEFNVLLTPVSVTKSQLSPDDAVAAAFLIPNNRCLFYRLGTHYSCSSNLDDAPVSACHADRLALLERAGSAAGAGAAGDCVMTVLVEGVATIALSVTLDRGAGAGRQDSQQVRVHLCGVDMTLGPTQRLRCQMTVDLTRFSGNTALHDMCEAVRRDLGLSDDMEVVLSIGAVGELTKTDETRTRPPVDVSIKFK